MCIFKCKNMCFLITNKQLAKSIFRLSPVIVILYTRCIFIRITQGLYFFVTLLVENILKHDTPISNGFAFPGWECQGSQYHRILIKDSGCAFFLYAVVFKRSLLNKRQSNKMFFFSFFSYKTYFLSLFVSQYKGI